MDITLPWSRHDPLTAAFSRVRMRGAFYSWTEAGGSVGVSMPSYPDTLSFHIIARGEAWLDLDGREPVRVTAGELALVPRGIGHRVLSAPGAPILGQADQLPQTMLGENFSVLRLWTGTGEAPVAMLCGVVGFDSAAVQTMLSVLPPLVRVDSSRHPMMAALLPLLANELRVPRPGGDAVGTRLADVLIIETIRAWLADDPGAAGGWLAALQDPKLGAVVAAVLAEPGHPWSLAELASRAAMSRSAFAARFAEVVGTPPMTYVAEARMRDARVRLGEGESIGAVALSLGYGSEAAFSRAFSRITGETPGRVRRAA